MNLFHLTPCALHSLRFAPPIEIDVIPAMKSLARRHSLAG
jgi:hypothetical protein